MTAIIKGFCSFEIKAPIEGLQLSREEKCMTAEHPWGDLLPLEEHWSKPGVKGPHCT